jgi:hypothetical protein
MSKPYEIHEIARCYPKITGKDFTELKKSIRAQGLINPITLFEGKILDGSNRYRACIEENVVPTFRELPEGFNPIEYVIAQNESRRHLTVEQRAFIGAKLAKLSAGGDRRSDGFKSTAGGMSTEKVAQTLKISSKSIERARRVQKEGTADIVEAAEKGEVNLSQAERLAALPKEQQSPALSTVKGQKEALARAKDFRQNDEFKARVAKHQTIIDAPSIFPIDLEVPDAHAQMVKDLRANEKHIGEMEAYELDKNTTKFAETIAKNRLHPRFVAWANSVKRKIAARHLILDAAKEYKKELQAEKTEKKGGKTPIPAPAKKVSAIDRQWSVFVPQFKALLKLFGKDDRLEIRARIDELLNSSGWPYAVLTPPDGGVVLS